MYSFSGADHTGISRDVVYRPREHVRDDAGHASMATTDKYIESDERERHASGKSKSIKDSVLMLKQPVLNPQKLEIYFQ